MSDHPAQARRKRGVILTAGGIQRLKQAIERVEAYEHGGQRYTLEELSSLVGVSPSTMSRLWSSQSGIDQRSLRLIFSAFALELMATDFQKVGPREAAIPGKQAALPGENRFNWVYPGGPVPLGSPFYILRPPLEARAWGEIVRPGCALRIKAPSGFGTSSLLLRVIDRAEQLGYAIASLDLQQTDPAILADPDRFLRWFCVACALQLGLEPRLEAWSDLVGSLLSTTLYLREHLLAQVNGPLVLNIQEFDRLFAYPETAQAFLPLLRSWHEETCHQGPWQNLRLVVSYATDSYLSLGLSQSPFNLGLPLTLPEFTAAQVSSLADRYGLPWRDPDCTRLMGLVGGHPTLIGIALYHLRQQDLSLEELLQTASTRHGIYHNRLQPMLARLQASPQLLGALEPLVSSDDAIALDPGLAYPLEGMGLIRAMANDGWRISCDLYRVYCRNCLSQLRPRQNPVAR